MYNDQDLDGWKQKRWSVAAAMQELGAQGWELVNVMWRKTGESSYSDPVYYFKRLKP